MNNFKENWRQLKQSNTAGQLLEALPDSWLNVAGTIVLFWLVLSPVFIMIRSAFIKDNDGSFYSLTLLTEWYVFVEQAGLLSWLLAGVFIAKNRYISRKIETASVRYSDLAVPFFLSLLLLWSALSFLFSDNHLLSWQGDVYRNDGLKSYILYGGFFALCWQIRSKKQIKAVVSALFFVSALLSLFSVLDLDQINDIFLLSRKTAVFFNANHYGYYLALTLPAAFYLIADRVLPVYQRFVIFFSFALISASLSFNQSLGPFLAVVIALIVLLSVAKWLKKPLRDIWLLLSLFIAVTVLVNLIQPSLLKDLLLLRRDLSKILLGADDAHKAGSSRWLLWTNGLEMALKKPLFGYGPDNLGKTYLARGISNDRPHNELIQLAASLGFPALLFYLTALISMLVNFYRRRSNISSTQLGLFAMILSYFVSSLFGNSMFYTTPFYFCILAFAASSLNQTKPALSSA